MEAHTLIRKSIYSLTTERPASGRHIEQLFNTQLQKHTSRIQMCPT